MTNYHAEVTREGKWWMVRIPTLDGLTQARRLGEAHDMAREFIAVSLDIPLDEVEVTITVEKVGSVNVSGALKDIRDDRERAAELERDAIRRSAELARALASEDVPVRDIGAALGVSFQRAHQLVQLSA